tara:strand:+ start:2581 stop:3309 length:729 start_codon:yes stop_codon:yes gene_type:complete
MVMFVDDRENDLVIHKLIARMGDRSLNKEGHLEVKRLPSADYVIGEWGIEAKEINDFYHSILGHGRSRTIVAQLHDLQENFENPMLVVYGTKWKPYTKGGPPRGAKLAQEIAKMVAITNKFKRDFHLRFPKIKFMQVSSMDEFVEYMVNMHKQLRIKGVTAQMPEFKKLPRRSPNLDHRIAVLVSLPGITEKMAKEILKKFGSIPKLLRSRTTLKSLMEVEGIGRHKARLILSLREQYYKGS